MADEVSLFEKYVCVHSPQLKKNEIPEIYWRSLHLKLRNEVYDAGEYFSIMQEEDDNTFKVIVTNEDGVKTSDPNSIFLIDHAWTYESKFARSQLLAYPPLAERMSALMGIKDTDKQGDARIDQVIQEMWRFNNTYQSKTVVIEDEITLWYVMDELGSRIQHSDEPTSKMALLYYAPMGISFSVIWPTMDLSYADELTRDYLPNLNDPLQRKAALLPWQQCDIEEEIDSHPECLGEDKPPLHKVRITAMQPIDGVFCVYVEFEQIHKALSHPKFAFVDNRQEADILWLVEHWKDFRSLGTSGQLVNQFPGEAVLTCKHLLAELCQRSAPTHESCAEERDELLCRGPYWLPVTYSINTELAQFVKHFRQREKRGLDNHWIIKPWNMGRGLNIQVSRNLMEIIRLAEAGPKIASKYIDKQVLFHRDDVGPVKFDVRYMLFVTSVAPLRLYVDRVFWLRFANKPFALDHFEEYDRHCTVMNYGTHKLKQIHHYDFIPMFNAQYPDHKWESIEEEFFEIFKELMQTAVRDPPPRGLGPCNQSRATYGVDIMVKWADDGESIHRIVPQVIEMNYSPDCTRICKYYPEYYNFVFSQLFLEDSMGWPVKQLL
ncbi:predicted protein [Nematostella vectensis]|uniref:Tubulin--tyrosine ligase-like protein 12 SET-like domain-containing protein n=1 Tax=Nematostella vectensis TaxID=45351 RepID=A7RF17_NEMVE|nr:predicted protein [Nematostella vectensis]|eukprot:XP_001641949.1 predicted protein [Nematostella vectensis]